MADPNPLAAFLTPASLWPPRLVHERSAWNEHIPFAGWIIETTRPEVFVELGTQTGVSYFAFCESVLRLGLGTRCYAIDTWLGDEHSGFYDEEVFRAVSEMNAQYYEPFSLLLRTTFDEAAESFDDGSIDLLHIDGLHSYEAISHDVETWLPKLSSRGLMLMHDTNERKRDFAVHRFFKELSSRYDTFEFTHGHGLGIVCVGEEQPQGVLDLVAIDGSPAATTIRGLYEALGRRHVAELSTALLSTELADHDRRLKRAARELVDAGAREKQLKEEAAIRDRDLDGMTDRVISLAQKSEVLSAQLAAQAIEAKRQRERVADIEGSRSWRVLAPVRLVADRFKSLFRRTKRTPSEPRPPS